MESFDLKKIFLGVAAVVYGVVFLKSLFSKNQPPEEVEPSQEDLEREFRIEQERSHQAANQAKRRVRPSTMRVESSPKPQISGESEVDGEKSKKRVDFDLRKAVIMSEILNPKYKEE